MTQAYHTTHILHVDLDAFVNRRLRTKTPHAATGGRRICAASSFVHFRPRAGQDPLPQRPPPRLGPSRWDPQSDPKRAREAPRHACRHPPAAAAEGRRRRGVLDSVSWMLPVGVSSQSWGPCDPVCRGVPWFPGGVENKRDVAMWLWVLTWVKPAKQLGPVSGHLPRCGVQAAIHAISESLRCAEDLY